MNPTFTTYKAIGENGPAWWPGEVRYMGELRDRCDGHTGRLIALTPEQWAFRRDPHDTGLPSGWAYLATDLAYWDATGRLLTPGQRKDYPDAWEMVRSDLYLQAQGIRHPDRQSYTGYYWYRTSLDLRPEQTNGAVHLIFPGLFNQCWLYINGTLIAHRPFPEPWWRNDYTFAWDVDVTGALSAGANQLTVRGVCPLHAGGMFRRPFLYRAVTP